MSFIHLLSTSLRFSRCHIIVLIIIVLLPIIPLFTIRPHPLQGYDVISQQSATSPSCSVVMATGTAQRRVIAKKPMGAGRLGNNMFVYASMLGIAARNQLSSIYPCDSLKLIFNVTATGSYVINPPAINVFEDSAFMCVVFPVLRLSFSSDFSAQFRSCRF